MQANASLGFAYLSGNAKISDPGASGTFDLRGLSHACVVLTTTGSYTLPSVGPGTTLFVTTDDTSTITLVDGAGATVAVFTGTSGTNGVLCIQVDANSWAGIRIAQNSDNSVVTAANVSIADSLGGFTDATTLENALNAISEALTGKYNGGGATYNWVGVPLTVFREVDSSGDVRSVADAAGAGGGGVLGSDSTPILLGDTNEAMCIQWAAGNSDIIAAQVALPPTFDGTAAATINLLVQSAGTTNAPSFSILTNWDGGTQVTDTATGTAVNTKQTITATVAASDIADNAQFLSFQIVPGTHATDAWTLYGVQVRCVGTGFTTPV